jgi:hypothetical protein
MRLRHEQPTDLALGQLHDDAQGGALPEVVDVRLEGQTEARDDGVLVPARRPDDLAEHVVGPSVVDLAGKPDEL